MIEKITDQNLERYDSRLKEWCDRKFFEKGNYGKYQTTEESGAVAFYPAPNTSLKGKVKFSFKETPPTSGDKGPDNPSTITGIDSITVTKTGKNLLYYPYNQLTRTSNGVTFTANEDGTVTINGTATPTCYFSVCDSSLATTAVSSKIGLIKGLNYTGSLKIISGSYSGILWFAANKKNSGADAFSPGILPGNSSQINWSNGNADEYLRYFLIAVNGSTFNNLVVSCQLELGSVATSFESYEGTDYTISLGNIYYGGEIDLATGVMTVTYVGYTFTGSEDYNWQSVPLTNVTRFYVSPLLRLPKNSQIAYCSHFPFLFDFGNDSTHFYVGTSAGGIFFYYPDPTMTVAQWKSWLASQYANNTPVTVCYEVAEPFTVQLTPLQIYSLFQLSKYTPRLNTVYTDADSIQISYLKSSIRDEYEKTQAILSLGGNS